MKLPAACLAASCVVVSLLTGPAVTWAQSGAATPSPVKVRLVAGRPAAARVASTWVAVRFDVEPGWHIYWQNPGDSGGPPQVRWQLPPGVTAGSLHWPVPERISTDGIVNYGYHGNVLLASELRAPSAGWPASPLPVTAQVKWLVCRDVCLPGKADVAIEVPPGPVAPDVQGAEIARSLARVPAVRPAGWRVTGSETRDAFTVSLETGRAEPTADFFPKTPGQVDAASPVVAAPQPRGISLTLRKSDFLSAQVALLEGVVVLSGGRAFEVSVPIVNHRHHP
jgi:DsbC/DsbD-like thiol-disulfide interchange protein